MLSRLIGALLFGGWLLAGTAVADGRSVIETLNADSITGQGDGDWFAHGRTYSEQRFSPLQQINASNVSRLGLAWSFDTDSTRGLEATPLVIDGVMYFTGTWSRVYALNAKTGEQLWQYDPQVPGETARIACCDVVNRGVAAWRGKIYVGTLDGRLVALNALTGKPVWSVKTVPDNSEYTITGAPRVVKGKVLIGNGGAEYGVRGYFTAYDAESGEMAWRFYTVPDGRNGKQEHVELDDALKTWSVKSHWQTGGGGTVWDSMAYDPKHNLLYVGVGNGSPWNREARSPGGGDNLFLSSILALDPDSGLLRWHYQTTPGDSWDYTATQHMILADIEINGQLREVLMQAPKNGFFYVLDRVTGELLSANNYVPLNWASHVDLRTGRPVETGKSNWNDEFAGLLPSNVGAHNWHPMAFHPGTGLVYIPAIDMAMVGLPEKPYRYQKGALNTALDVETLMRDSFDQLSPPLCTAGKLIAWDPKRQQAKWEVSHRGHWNGGVLATAGNLVFQGTQDGRLAAYRADLGEKLWEVNTTAGVMAPPISYSIDDEQYVAVLAGYGGAGGMIGLDVVKMGPMAHSNQGRLLVFKLDGKATMPALADRPRPMMPAEGLEWTKLNYYLLNKSELIDGGVLYGKYCVGCHGGGAISVGVVPDLRGVSLKTHAEWDGIVLGGLRRDKGMASFIDVLSVEDSEKIRAYVIYEALKTRDQGYWNKLLKSAVESICVPPWVLDLM